MELCLADVLADQLRNEARPGRKLAIATLMEIATRVSSLSQVIYEKQVTTSSVEDEENQLRNLVKELHSESEYAETALLVRDHDCSLKAFARAWQSEMAWPYGI